MDGNQAWSDFHFLNTAFSDVMDTISTKWVETSLVRLSYRGNRDKAANRTVKAFDGLLVEYAVPFPLTYVFGPRVLQVYNSILVFLLQIRRAKSVLERILVRGSISSPAHLGSDSKILYAMRGKLSWFIKYVVIDLAVCQKQALIFVLQHIIEFLDYTCMSISGFIFFVFDDLWGARSFTPRYRTSTGDFLKPNLLMR
jgi:hypothetical protein